MVFIYLNNITTVSRFYNEERVYFEGCSKTMDDRNCDHRLSTNKFIEGVVKYSQIGKFVLKYLMYNHLMYTNYNMVFITARLKWLDYRFELRRNGNYDNSTFNSPTTVIELTTYPPKIDRILIRRQLDLTDSLDDDLNEDQLYK